MPAEKSPSSAAPAHPLSRPATRAVILEDIARVFIQSGDRDAAAAAAFAEIGAAMIPRVAMSSAVAVARMLAGRKDAPAEVLAALAARGLKPKGASSPAAIAPRPRARTPATTKDAAGRSALQGMIADAARLAPLDSAPELRRRADSVAVLALARAAERRDREDVVAILAKVLSLPPAALEPLFGEASGELVAIACRAAGLEDGDAIRIFVGVGPEAARAGAGLREAMGGFRSIDQPTAARLLRTITGTGLSRPAAAAEPVSARPRRPAAGAATLPPRSDAQSGSQQPAAATPPAGRAARNQG